MRGAPLAILFLAAGCGDNSHGAAGVDATVAGDHDAASVDAPPPPPDAAPDHLQAIYDEVDAAHLAQLVREMSGAVPVTVGGETFTIDERYSDLGRQHFRAYWTQYMTGLGLTVTPLPYQAAGHPRSGDDVEAVLPGSSADSIVVIVHYDSIGPDGMETMNPGADDDMTGMAIELETARILVAHRTELKTTVRFVASDEEELGGLGGARAYGKYVKGLAQTSGFALVAAVDDEQTGWNCRADHSCPDSLPARFDVFSCGQSQTEHFSNPALGDQLASIVATYSPLGVTRACMGANSDHFAMWEAGIPSVVFSEHDPFDNPHFDQEGGDVFAALDLDYFVAIARPAITFQAALAGLTK